MSPNEINIVYWALVVVIAAFTGLTLFKLWRADLTGLIQETDGNKASLSRDRAK
ncbi:MAG: hypothetical protein ABW278_15705 [Steroidobacteraceae bacterium]